MSLPATCPPVLCKIGTTADRLKHSLPLVLSLMLLGCQQISMNGSSSWYQEHDWIAAEYFDDPQILKLCAAIETGDIQACEQLIADGADVQIIGAKGVTPLLWALPGPNPELFERLLKLGADPNAKTTGQIGKDNPDTSDATVTLMAARFGTLSHFVAVMNHGGDPDTMQEYLHRPLLHVLITHRSVRDRANKIDALLPFEPDLDAISGTAETPMMAATGRGSFETALKLLDAGANPNVYKQDSNQKLIHYVVREGKKQNDQWRPERKAAYIELLNRLVNNGDSVHEAEEDLARWAEWGRTLPVKRIGELRRQEIAERMAQEK